MAKVLKIFIVLQLLVSIAALALGVILFAQREVLKTRTQNLENGAQAFADSIRFEEFRKDQLVVKLPEDFPTQQRTLKGLAAKGQDQWQELQDTIQELAITRKDLAETRETLEATKIELGDARDQIAQLTQDLNETEAELAQANERIADLDDQVADLGAELAALKDDFADLEEQRDDLVVNLEGCQKELNIAIGLEEIDATGKVLLVSHEWNFVVLDIGKEKHVVPDKEMLIHRGDELVGRVRISAVEPKICVAEILPGSDTGEIQRGDYAISPEG